MSSPMTGVDLQAPEAERESVVWLYWDACRQSPDRLAEANGRHYLVCAIDDTTCEITQEAQSQTQGLQAGLWMQCCRS